MLDYVTEITPRLWRWTARHPEWRPGAEPESPGDWDPVVGSVLYATDHDAVFIDPLLPEDPEPFWSWADQLVRERDVAVLTTITWHRRSREAFATRYQASTSRAKSSLPDGVEALSIKRAGETMFWLPEPRVLIPGDRILGTQAGGLRTCPDSWLRYLGRGMTGAQLKQTLQPLLALPVAHVLVSHGAPVLGDGAAALRKALATT